MAEAGHSEVLRKLVHVCMVGFALFLRWIPWWLAALKVVQPKRRRHKGFDLSARREQISQRLIGNDRRYPAVLYEVRLSHGNVPVADPLSA